VRKIVRVTEMNAGRQRRDDNGADACVWRARPLENLLNGTELFDADPIAGVQES
jgi:hypothetical protein